MNAEEFFNNGFGEDAEKIHRKHVIHLMTNFANYKLSEQLRIGVVVRQSEHLVCPNCKQPFTKEELEVKEHCFNCGWEFAN